MKESTQDSTRADHFIYYTTTTTTTITPLDYSVTRRDHLKKNVKIMRQTNLGEQHNDRGSTNGYFAATTDTEYVYRVESVVTCDGPCRQ